MEGARGRKKDREGEGGRVRAQGEGTKAESGKKERKEGKEE